jgi:hypothetical protein
MDVYDSLVNTISLTLGAAWASGINLYAAILVLGLLSITGNIVLPETLHILENPLVIAAAGLMYIVEFFADKLPALDTGWDSVHTFIRIPAGVLLAAGAVGDVNAGVTVAAGILGGAVSAGSHSLKAGSRVLINTSPEPFTNWAASIAEDIAVVAGLWAAVNHPWYFIIFLILFIILLIWLLPKIWRGIKKILQFIGKLFGCNSGNTSTTGNASPDNHTFLENSGDIEQRLNRLEDLKQKGVITQEEYHEKRQALINSL